MIKTRVTFWVVVLSAAVASGEIRLPAVIGDHMVLQQGVELPFWGWELPGQTITVTLAKQSGTVRANVDGRWRVYLPPMPAGGPHELIVKGKNTVKLQNVMVGEVWLCSGQSNMLWEVRRTAHAEQEIAAADYPNLRLFTVTKKTIDQPAQDVRGWWLPCDPSSVANFSAVAYTFGRELHKELDTPIGLIQSSVSGSAVEAWTPRETLATDAELRAAADQYDEEMDSYQAKKMKEYEQALANWQTQADQAKAEGKEPPKKPNVPKPPPKSGAYFNGMIFPLAPYPIAGVIWYQGESNVDRPELYARQFPALIASWRRLWGQEDLPFLFVQLANYKKRYDTPTDSDWARLREAQLKSLAAPHTAMAVAIDLGEADDIHPTNKQDVGKRLALAALRTAYRKDVVRSGPIFQEMRIEGDKAILHFKHIGSGLVAKGDKLTGFAIAGADRRFVWAEATIEGEEVIVSSPQVLQPAAVRYAWADNPECNLYNKEGLPASPFRTDDWPRERPTTSTAPSQPAPPQ